MTKVSKDSKTNLIKMQNRIRKLKSWALVVSFTLHVVIINR